MRNPVLKGVLAFGVAALTTSWLIPRFAALRYSLRGKVVVISGGSRGLGLVLAREYAAHGARLLLVARDAEELARAEADVRARTPDCELDVLPCDIRDPDQVDAAIEWAISRFGRLDVLVNVAGEIVVGPIESLSSDDWASAMETNFEGPLRFSSAAIPVMQPGSRIVNISSIGGLVPVPHLLPYVASKFALTGTSLGLRIELAKDGIRVVTVCPGLMRTGSARNALFRGNRRRESTWFAASDALPIVSMNAERAARRIVLATRSGEARVILTPQAKLAAMAMAIAPGLVTFLLAGVNRLLPSLPTVDEVLEDADDGSPDLPAWLSDLDARDAEKYNEVGAALR